MKNKILLLCFLIVQLLMASVFAQQNQVPNAGFENWLSATELERWTTGNNIGGIVGDAITRSNNAIEGTYSVKGEIVESPILPGFPWVPTLWLGFQANPPAPITQRFTHLTGKYILQNINQYNVDLSIQVIFHDSSMNPVAYGLIHIVNASSTYTDFEVTMDYNISTNNNDPVWLQIIIALTPDENDPGYGIGSYFIMDALNLTGNATSVEFVDDKIPQSFLLNQNYPNPFNPSTIINFSLPEASFVTLKVYNIQGEEVATLIEQELLPGVFNVEWNAENNPSGVYFYSLTTQNKVQSRKMILLR